MKNQSRIYKLLLGVALIAELVCFAPDIEAQCKDSRECCKETYTNKSPQLPDGYTLQYNSRTKEFSWVFPNGFRSVFPKKTKEQAIKACWEYVKWENNNKESNWETVKLKGAKSN